MKKKKKNVEYIVKGVWIFGQGKREDIELSRFLSWAFVVKFYVHTPIH